MAKRSAFTNELRYWSRTFGPASTGEAMGSSMILIKSLCLQVQLSCGEVCLCACLLTD